MSQRSTDSICLLAPPYPLVWTDPVLGLSAVPFHTGSLPANDVNRDARSDPLRYTNEPKNALDFSPEGGVASKPHLAR